MEVSLPGKDYQNGAMVAQGKITRGAVDIKK